MPQTCVCCAVGQMTDSAMLTFTLRRLRASVVLLAPFFKLQRKFLRQVLTIFGGADKAPRLQALLFIRHMAAMLPPPALELALKVSLPCPSLHTGGVTQQHTVCSVSASCKVCYLGFRVYIHGLG